MPPAPKCPERTRRFLGLSTPELSAGEEKRGPKNKTMQLVQLSGCFPPLGKKRGAQTTKSTVYLALGNGQNLWTPSRVGFAALAPWP